MATHEFGGDWTQQKLDILDSYLAAYCQIFRTNERAKFFKTVYVDAFAGSGVIKTKADQDQESSTVGLLAGSAALAIRHFFDKYFFIEKSADRVAELEKLKANSEAKDRIFIRHGDANPELMEFIQSTDWKTHRAVVFLDPYGMQVEWQTIKALGGTNAIDLWFLFPLGQAVMRLLLRGAEPPPEWRSRLDAIFGTPSWKEEFYITSVQGDFFIGDVSSTQRHADWRAVKEFLVKRLETAFYEVHSKPAVLRNSKNVPIYVFCFAASNPVGAKTALKIANHLLKPFDN